MEVVFSTNLAEETSASDIVLQSSIQKQLELVCNRMRITEPVYTLLEVKDEQGLKFVRYHACLSSSFMDKPLVAVGRFAKNDYDAKEDVAVILMRHLLKATGRRIRDYNSYNVQVLSEELQRAMDVNFELNMEIAALKAENMFLSTQP
jgi:hypothetical protein